MKKKNWGFEAKAIWLEKIAFTDKNRGGLARFGNERYGNGCCKVLRGMD